MLCCKAKSNVGQTLLSVREPEARTGATDRSVYPTDPTGATDRSVYPTARAAVTDKSVYPTDHIGIQTIFLNQSPHSGRM
jgi:hypothetical protein